ncbi:hypothetical protein ACIRSU_15830 [Streptomyces sp. NPDC101160]|uniref:hypothetical protein n=1 Tax=Streptomyces sp. NPDC101160 TaxID=3366118 RepID=UPI003828F242
MASHTKLPRLPRLRAAAVTTTLCAALVAGAGPAALAAAAQAPPPDPFKGLTADQIADKAVTATQSATSLRLAGRVVSGGQPLDVDFSVNDHHQCAGVVRLQGGAAELRQTGTVTYMKGDEAFWRASLTSQGMPEPQIEATIELLKGRWLKIPQGQPGTENLSGVCDLKALLADLGRNKAERTGLTRGPDARVKGTPVATLVKRKAEGTAVQTTTVSVSERGKPYILRMVKRGGPEPGVVVLSDYDKPVKVVVPPADQTVDLSKLEQGSSTPV